jgi:hypothetical protein
MTFFTKAKKLAQNHDVVVGELVLDRIEKFSHQTPA